MKLRFLGTGTSTGVPMLGCHCEVCRSADPRDNRLRCSALLTTDTGKNLLIDCGPDFRQQMLSLDSPQLDALLVTHTHYDHLGGIDDLRPYCYREGGFPIYCREDVRHDIHTRMPYCFGPNRYPGAPVYNIQTVEPYKPFEAAGVEITPLEVMHTPTLPILGFRIGTFAYITDCKTMPERTLEQLRGVDTLVINALRAESHPSHLNLRQALDVIKSIQPRQAYLTHFSHDMGLHSAVEPTLPEGVRMAYDGLEVTI